MDLVFKKYASPFPFIDSMIQMGRLTEFVSAFVGIVNDDMMWEYYLHKVDDKSFADWKEEIEGPEEVEHADVETTIQDSKNILNGFIPN